MAAPTIAGTASGSIAIACTPGNAGPGSANGTGAWGTVGAPTFLAIFNPGDVTAYIVTGGTGVSLTNANGVLSPTPIPVLPNSVVYLSTSGVTNLAAVTLRNGTQLTITPST